MRAVVMAVIGLLVLTSRRFPRSKKGSRLSRTSAMVGQVRKAIGDIYRIMAGTEHRMPSGYSLAVVAMAGLACAWLAGFTWKPAFSLGIAFAVGLYLRHRQVKKRRQSELPSSWPWYLERVRSKMLASSRSVAYVFFEEDVPDFQFLGKLLHEGRREFENSGNLTKSLETVWEMGEGEETTSYVCESLLDTLGSTSSQIENQLAIISSTIRSRNELRQETHSRLAGVRTARTFIVIIPLGMALAGVSFAGSLRPFLSPSSLLQLLAGLAITVLCWYWSSRLMAFPSLPTGTARKLLSDQEALP